MDLVQVHRWISEQSYWAAGVPMETLRRALEHSIGFAGFIGTRQVAFARVTTDRATFAYLADVFVDEDYRGLGYSKILMEAVLAHPDLQGLRRFVLATRDAHDLYRRYGFTPLKSPDLFMEIHRPDIYRT
ncbi:MAG: GNAT family N-acetyltransferase [Gammaproteobacteria bacterium]|nr:GNAT family N-acetyltransferase [Gammaproteobacteria bacterium]